MSEYISADPIQSFTMYNPPDVRWDVLIGTMSQYYLRLHRILGLNGVQACIAFEKQLVKTANPIRVQSGVGTRANPNSVSNPHPPTVMEYVVEEVEEESEDDGMEVVIPMVKGKQKVMCY